MSVRYKKVRDYSSYRIGTDGSLWTNLWCVGFSTFKVGPWRKMQPYKTIRGYVRTRLSKDGVVAQFPVHRLVLEAFVGPCPEGMEACHGNGIRDDNRLENLRWDTKSANQQDSIRHGTKKSGKEKLTPALAEEIRSLQGTATQKEIAKRYGVDRTAISRIFRGKNWNRPSQVMA